MKPLLLVLFISVALTGCSFITESAAMRPYDKALKEGRMSPVEYQKMQQEIHRQAIATDEAIVNANRTK